MTGKIEQDRRTMPGDGPTDEDLRHDAELTRQELAETVAALTAKANINARVRDAARRRTEPLRALADRLPEPVTARVRPAITTATRHPAIPLAALAALLLALRLWLKHHR